MVLSYRYNDPVATFKSSQGGKIVNNLKNKNRPKNAILNPIIFGQMKILSYSLFIFVQPLKV